MVGWDGMVYPYTFNADDFEPITGTVHQPPPIHQTFEATGLRASARSPRGCSTRTPRRSRCPTPTPTCRPTRCCTTSAASFGSRRGVEEASFTLHPRGIPHGPHPGTIVASRPVTRTDELAVMVDTVRPLQLTRQALEMDDPSYPYSWLE